MSFDEFASAVSTAPSVKQLRIQGEGNVYFNEDVSYSFELEARPDESHASGWGLSGSFSCSLQDDFHEREPETTDVDPGLIKAVADVVLEMRSAGVTQVGCEVAEWDDTAYEIHGPRDCNAWPEPEAYKHVVIECDCGNAENYLIHLWAAGCLPHNSGVTSVPLLERVASLLDESILDNEDFTWGGCSDSN